MKRFYIVFFLFAPCSLFAYLDPGTGSLLLYALVGIAASLVFALRNLWYRLQELLFKGHVSKHDAAIQTDLVFHSEGGRYWPVFEPILSALDARGIPCVYVTPDSADPAIRWAAEHSNVTVFNPGNELMSIAWMNRTRAKIVVSTTPNLDVYMWKRSPTVERYVHIFHAPTTVEFYEKYALCFYDDIFTVGSFQEKAIRELDEKRLLPQKKFHPVGLTYYDYMVREVQQTVGDSSGIPASSCGKATVLYAPSWGSRSSLVLFGKDLVSRLLDSGYRVLFRPHPQSAVSDAAVLSDILTSFEKNPLFCVDRNLTGIAAMKESGFMITDFSGVLFDYAYLFGKPIVLAAFDTPVTGGYEAEDVDGPLWDIESAQKLSRPLPENLDELPALLEEIVRNNGQVQAENLRFRDETVLNFAHAGEAAAECLHAMLGGNR